MQLFAFPVSSVVVFKLLLVLYIVVECAEF